MTRYTELWHQIEERLIAAHRLLYADAPMSAARIEAELHNWLDHNELELALDEILNGVIEGQDVLRRRFWEEVLTAAMLLQLERQFLWIAERIPELEPHPLREDHLRPYVSCDFNGGIEQDVYCLNAVQTALDFARLQLLPTAFQDVVLYDKDLANDGTPTWLCVPAQILEHEPWGLVAKADATLYNWQPR